MTRWTVLGTLVLVGGLSIGVSAARQGAQAQPRTVQVEKLHDNLFVLRGGGGNTAVFVTTDGVVVVDTKNPGWGQPILDKIKELSPKPVTLLINTHTHGDHVSGNVEFPESVDVVVQANTKTNMEKMKIFAENANRGMAKRTFTDRMTIGKGPDQIDLYYFGPGHTNGDAFVVFPSLRTMHAGDIFGNKGLPLIDAGNGGSVLHVASTLQKAHAGIKGVETIINGHMTTQTTWDDLKTFAEFNQDFLTWAQAELKAGKTPEEAAKGWTVPEKYVQAGYSATAPTNFGGLVGRLQRLQEEMGKK
jgi:glyoxylase-like metal-dependent hydrolase (beta-lactamase superfamily II)